MAIIYAGNFAELMGFVPFGVEIGEGVTLSLPGGQSVSCDLNATDEGEELWVHVVESTPVRGNWFSVAPVLQVLAGDTTFKVAAYTNAGKLYASIVTPSGTSSGVPWTYAGTVTYSFDMRCRFSGGNAICDFYVNGALVSTASRAATPAPFETASWGNDLGVRSAEGANTVSLQQFIVATEDTRGRLVTMLDASGGDGTYLDWIGDGAKLADFDPLTGVTTASSANIQSRLMEVGDIDSVTAVVVATRYLPSAGAPRLSHLLRIDGDDFFGAIKVPGVGAPAQVVATVFALNPATEEPWAAEDFAALEAGFRSESPA